MKILIAFIFIGLLVALIPIVINNLVDLQFGALPSSQGVFKTYDAGNIWFLRSDLEFGGNISKVGINDIAMDFKDHNVLYLGSQNFGLFKSIQNGESWRKIQDENRNLNDDANVYKVIVSPINSEIIFLAAFQNKRGFVFKSEDGGRSFDSIYVVPNDNIRVLAMEMDLKNPSILYIGTSQGGLLESIDGGNSWKIVKWFDGPINKILINQKNSAEIYVYVVGKGLFKTIDRGKNWNDLTEKIRTYSGAEQIKILAIDSSNVNIVYSGSSYGLLRSLDGGFNWSPVKVIIPPDALPVTAIAFDPADPKIIYIGGGSRIYKSEDRGEHWSVKKLNTNEKISDILVDFVDSKIVFVGIYRKEN